MPKGNWVEFQDSSKQEETISNSFKVRSKSDLQVRVQTTRVGRKGKTVTLIMGLGDDEVELKRLLKCLKARCGAGGSVKGQSLEIQGDQVKVSLELLKKEGYCPK